MVEPKFNHEDWIRHIEIISEASHKTAMQAELLMVPLISFGIVSLVSIFNNYHPILALLGLVSSIGLIAFYLDFGMKRGRFVGDSYGLIHELMSDQITDVKEIQKRWEDLMIKHMPKKYYERLITNQEEEVEEEETG